MSRRTQSSLVRLWTSNIFCRTLSVGLLLLLPPTGYNHHGSAVGGLLALAHVINVSSEGQHQTVFNTFPSDPKTNSVTLIDLLSNSTDHSKLLRFIQRARLVPTINLLNSSTLFAPTNAAIDFYLDSHPESALAFDSPPQDHDHDPSDFASFPGKPIDNIQFGLRQTLLYHLLNYSLPSSISSDSPELLETLLRPLLPPTHTRPQLIESWESTPDLLGGQGQKLRFIQREGVVFIGVNAAGEGGTPIPPPSDFRNATNGVLVSIDRVLTPPPSLTEILKQTPSLSTYLSILPSSFIDQLESVPHLTVFAAENNAWLSLDPIELAYLKSSFSTDDSIHLFRAATSANVLHKQAIGYADVLRQDLLTHPGTSTMILTLAGQHISIGLNSSSSLLTVNGSEIVENDVLASNGVLHVVPHLLLPSGGNSLGLNAEKYLLAMNCTQFVSLFRSANLSGTYLTNTSSQTNFTILALRDDSLDPHSSVKSRHKILAEKWRLSPTNDTEGLRRSLTYHVIRGSYLPEDLSDGMLLRTELDLAGDSDLKQRMPVSVSASDGKGASDIKEKNTNIGFGGINVVGGRPVQVGNTVIYILSQPISPPTDLMQTALSNVRLTTCVASIYAAELDDEFKSLSSVTFFVPTNKAFLQLGLIMKYLLLVAAKEDLRQVLRYHAVTELVYQKDIKIGDSRRYPTLEGTEIYISKLGTKNVTLHGPTVGGISLNGENKDSEVINKKDVLIENGSMNLVNQVELPSGLIIDMKKLMLGAKATTMLDLIQSSNLSWVLTSGYSGKSDELEGPGHSPDINLARSYTVLCPTDEAFTKINLTYYLEDRVRLQSLVLQHIIPTHPDSSSSDQLEQPRPEPFKPLYIDDGKVYRTLLSKTEGGPSSYGDVSFRSRPMEVDQDEESEFKRKWVIGIVGARGTDGHHDSARLINYGRASPRVIKGDDGGSEMVMFGGGVLVLDMVLEPYEPNAWDRWGKTVIVSIVVLGFCGGLAVFLWKVYFLKKNGAGVGGYQYVEPMEE